MKVIKKLLSRTVIVLFVVLVQILLYIYVVGRLAENYFYFALTLGVVGILVALAVINRDMSASYKVPWIITLIVMPVAGIILYILLGNPRLTRKQHKKQVKIMEETAKYCRQSEEVLDCLESESLLAASQAKFLCNVGGMPLYANTQTKYFESGEAAFEVLKERLKEAKKYIFMEYFIIEEGKMWNEILDILVKKAHEGVRVKIIYDDFGCSGRLKNNYDKKLRAMGIDCIKFNKLTFIVTAMHNNRDHRKITVIDGAEAFVGGFNLCDEYINVTSPYGYWKDTAVYLRGTGVQNLTVMFLTQFAGQSNQAIDFEEFLQAQPPEVEGQGYVLPFCDAPAPLLPEYVGEEAYLNIINQAKRYVYITTPYLIVDYHFIKALKAAAKRGVDVRIITPGIADKKLINIMTKSSYERLIKGGVKIYEFVPGFIHAKSFVCDDEIGVVGTINLDYRSLVHHFECGVWMYKTAAVSEMKCDFDNTLYNCRQIQSGKALKWYQKIVATVISIFAPLM